MLCRGEERISKEASMAATSDSNSNPLAPFVRLNRLLTHILSFLMGVSLVLFLSFYLKSFPAFDFQAIQLMTFSPTLPPSPSPSSQPPNDRKNQTPKNNIYRMTMHNLSDDELLRRATMVPKVNINVGKNNIAPKVAFLFLTGGQIPLSPLWDKFFQGHQGLFSIYVHPHPDYNDTTTPPSSVFYSRRIPSQPVYWGTISMVDAERRLLANALLDLSNQRFVLLSESCIPLFNFTTVYGYLMKSNQSFLSLYDNPRKEGRGRYNPQMSPLVNLTHWRKGSQWFEMQRDLALRVVSDQKYYWLFRDKCQPPCYNDEHYIPTLVNMFYGEMNSNRSVTWVDWSRGGPHPRRYGRKDITDDFLNWVRFGSECAYDGSTTRLCFMFARKFGYNALDPLLRRTHLLFG